MAPSEGAAQHSNALYSFESRNMHVLAQVPQSRYNELDPQPVKYVSETDLHNWGRGHFKLAVVLSFTSSDSLHTLAQSGCKYMQPTCIHLTIATLQTCIASRDPQHCFKILSMLAVANKQHGTYTCNSSPGGSMRFGMESQRRCVSRCGSDWHRDGAAQAAAVGAAVPLLRCICRVIGRPEGERGASAQRRLACSK